MKKIEAYQCAYCPKSSVDLEGLVRMPLTCVHHKYMSDDEQAKRFNV